MNKNPLKIAVLENNQIKYQIKLSRGRSFRMHYNASGILLISYPVGTKISSLEQFVEKNIDWILAKAKVLETKKVSYENNSTHLFLGKEYLLKVNFSKTNRLDVVGNEILVSVSDLNKVAKLMIEWRLNEATIIFEELLYQCFIKMNQLLKSYPKLIIKPSKSKWGCCYFNENKIMLNVALTQVPIYLIEYVIFHELTHFVVHNHSKEFHLVLSSFVPDEKARRKELKKYSNIL